MHQKKCLNIKYLYGANLCSGIKTYSTIRVSFRYIFRHQILLSNFILKMERADECQITSPLINSISNASNDPKMGNIKKSSIKRGAFRKNTWLDFEQEKDKNWNCSILGYYQKMHMPSRATCIFQILFGAFRVTPRIMTVQLLSVLG